MLPIKEQTILITGATSGLGRELAQALAKQGAMLLLHGRDAGRGLETVRQIKEATGNDRNSFQIWVRTVAIGRPRDARIRNVPPMRIATRLARRAPVLSGASASAPNRQG
jgi:NAD(P)-dependent dehydrogenase (short-subunit alcohol dehydrogenase family)